MFYHKNIPAYMYNYVVKVTRCSFPQQITLYI